LTEQKNRDIELLLITATENLSLSEPKILFNSPQRAKYKAQFAHPTTRPKSRPPRAWTVLRAYFQQHLLSAS